MQGEISMGHAILLISCLDQKGITAAVTNFIFNQDGNIIHADQHIDEQSNTFFMRVEWAMDESSAHRDQLAADFQSIADTFNMDWKLDFSDRKLRVALFVSKHLHVMIDVLYRHAAGQLFCEIPLIISNHPDGREIAEHFNIPYFEIAVLKESKRDSEEKQQLLLKEYDIDTLVLARYHQVLSSSFVDQYVNQVINIHHSFLPAFAGRKPYDQAYRKGVKIIGATSHYVTEVLDEGPIIDQDTVRISHRDSLDDLIRKGEDLEKIVLNRALRLHLERRILGFNNKTVIFD